MKDAHAVENKTGGVISMRKPFSPFICLGALLCLITGDLLFAQVSENSVTSNINELHNINMKTVFTETFSKDLHQFGPNAALKEANAKWGNKKWLDDGCLALSIGATKPGADKSIPVGTFSGIDTLYVPYLILTDGRIQLEFFLDEKGAIEIGFRTNEEEQKGLILGVTPSAVKILDAQKKGQKVDVITPPIQHSAWHKLTLSWLGTKCAVAIDDLPVLYTTSIPEGRGGIFVRTGGRSKLQIRNLKVSTPPDSNYEPYRVPGQISSTKREVSELPPAPKEPLLKAPGLPYCEELVHSDGETKGILVDETGKKHKWELKEGLLSFDEETLIPVRGGDGEYFARYSNDIPVPPVDNIVLQRVKKYGLSWSPVILAPVDYIDCTKEDHGYTCDPVADGRTRIMEINGRKYRVTSCRKSLSYFSYVLNTPHVFQPHVIIAEMPNDRERYTVIRQQPPAGELSNYMYCIGVGSYTGRELPCDHAPFYQFMMVYPKDNEVRISISRLPKETEFHPDNGAAVSRIWFYRLDNPLWNVPDPISYPEGKEQRTLSVSLSAPAYIYRIRSNEIAWENKETKNNCEADYFHYLRFTGINGIMPFVIDGNDATTAAYYEGSKYFPGPVAEKAFYPGIFTMAKDFDLQSIPAIPPIICHPNLKIRDTLSRDAYLRYKDGHPVSWIWPNLDPIHPDTQAIQFGLLKEMCALAKGNKHVTGISFRVYAEIGSCFSRGPAWLKTTGADSGYSKWDIEQFKADTSISVPTENSTDAYNWLKQNAWNEWIDWRCKRMRDVWLKCRDVVKSFNPDWDLIIRIGLPGSGYDRYQLWNKDKMTIRELFRTYGFDPVLFIKDEGIRFVRTSHMASDRFVSDKGWAGSNLDDFNATRAIDYAPEVKQLYASLNNGFELYMGYWEEHGSRFGSSLFGGRTVHWGAATVTPFGRYFFQPILQTIVDSNPYTISLLSWEGGTLGHEHALRRFARLYLSLPAVKPEKFNGEIIAANSADIWTGWFGDRLAVVNLGSTPGIVRVQSPCKLQAGEKIIEAGTGAIVFTAKRTGDENVSVELFMDAFDLAVLYTLKNNVK